VKINAAGWTNKIVINKGVISRKRSICTFGDSYATTSWALIPAIYIGATRISILLTAKGNWRVLERGGLPSWVAAQEESRLKLIFERKRRKMADFSRRS
jgi:hypothetical protein